MSSYNVETCNFKYRVSSLEKVVDGDTIDVNIDLGFDVCTKQRVRLLGIDTPESRTSDAEEKVFGLLSKKKLKEWCMKAVASEKDDIEIELRCPEADSRGKFGCVRMVTGPMSTSGCVMKGMPSHMVQRIRLSCKTFIWRTARS